MSKELFISEIAFKVPYLSYLWVKIIKRIKYFGLRFFRNIKVCMMFMDVLFYTSWNVKIHGICLRHICKFGAISVRHCLHFWQGFGWHKMIENCKMILICLPSSLSHFILLYNILGETYPFYYELLLFCCWGNTLFDGNEETCSNKSCHVHGGWVNMSHIYRNWDPNIHVQSF